MDSSRKNGYSGFPSVSNLKTGGKFAEFSPIFLKPLKKMCFDIDVEKLDLPTLRQFLTNIRHLLNSPSVVANLPDGGHQLRQTRLKLEKEIKFREALEATQSKMESLSIKSASESEVGNAHSIRLFSLDRTMKKERFLPNMNKKKPSGRCESMQELRTTQFIDLPTSLALQREQRKREKEERLRAKQAQFIPKYENPFIESDEAQEDNAEHMSFDEEQPGPSGTFSTAKKDNTEHIEPMSSDEDQPGPSGIVSITKAKEDDSSEEDDD